MLFLSVLLFTACQSSFYRVQASLETAPVQSVDDAADDPALFIHPDDPTKSAIIGTDKQRGLTVYDVNGNIVHEYEFGRINNVDIRQHVAWKGEQITVVGGSNRTDNTVVFYRLNEATLELTPLFESTIRSKVDEVYGFCLYQPKKEDDLYAFVVGKDGQVEMYALVDSDDVVPYFPVLSFDVGGQCEGLVADDDYRVLYVGEEEVGIWAYDLKENIGEQRKAVQLISDNKALKADIEGLTIYYGQNGGGYLIASSQGNNSYAIYERTGDHHYLGSFRIDKSDTIENTFDTDGIDVTSAVFGTQFPEGVFIAQDGKNGKEPQNFKIVDWRVIEAMFSSNTQ
jgi:3-phytase